MKKQIKHIFSLMILVSAFTACTSESISEVTSVASQTNGVPFTLKLTNKDKINSRGTYVEKSEEGESTKNENIINHADIFFYTDADGDAVYKYPYNPDPADDKTAEIKGSIPTDVIDVLFNGTNKCIAYAVVNGPVTPDEGDGTSIAKLKAIEIGATFDTELTEECFVMDGQSTEITYGNNTVSGTIELYRAAAKIQLYINELTDYVDDAGNTWSPQKGTDTEFPITVEFYNGTKKSRIDWDDMAISLESADYFDIADDASRKLTGNDTNGYTHAPFYSYPSSWSSDGDANEAYLYLRIYWAKTIEKNSDGTLTNIESPNYEPYYYRVPINLEGDENNNYAPCQLTRNTFYKININVGVLGDSEKNTGKTTLEPTYTIVDWKTIDIEAELSDYHYLVVEKDFVEMFNTTETTIGYEACGDITAEIISISIPDFSTNTIGTITYSTSDSNDAETIFTVEKNSAGTSNVNNSTSNLKSLLNDCTLTLDKVQKQVTLSHELENDNSTTPYDYAIYTIVVRLTTTDGCNLSQDITIKQYPARYIEGENTTSNDKGTVWINGNNSGQGSNTSPTWDYVTNSLEGTGDNSNPNAYVITVTAFNDNTYIIADPRDLGVGYTGTTLADALGISSQEIENDNNDYTMVNYYPTLASTEDNISDGDDYRQHLIAPKFRVATAYGRKGSGSINNNKDYAVMRCASYQEYGRPAGRWRVPTPAELNYLGKLCSDGIIPALFKQNGSYFSSFGGWSWGDGVDLNSTAASVRCVYDEWYWGDDTCELDVFTWSQHSAIK